MSVEFRRASPEDARLLAETRRRAWDTTYRGIYPDAMIDEYDLEAPTARTNHSQTYRKPSTTP